MFVGYVSSYPTMAHSPTGLNPYFNADVGWK
jgi:hypothetical protein